MIVFNVIEMTCGHCVAAVTKAVQGVEPNATVNVDLSTHRVEILGASASAEAFAQAMRDEGYTPLQQLAS
jgi:copper chaperone